MSKNIISLVVLLGLFIPSFAQTGEVYVNFPFFPDTVKGHCLLIKNNDSISFRFQSSDDTTMVVPGGLYSLKYFINDSLKAVHFNLNVKGGRENRITLPCGYISGFDRDTTLTSYMSTNFFALYGTAILENKSIYQIKDSYEFGFTQGAFEKVGKKYFLGILFGTNFQQANFYKSRTIAIPGPHDKERYFAWNFNMCLMNRWHFAKSKHRDYFIDFGIGYNLPFLFRHVIVDGNTRTQTSRIRKFNDMYGIIKIGGGLVALQAEYSFFDNLFVGYPEMPRIQVGVVLNVFE